MKKRSLFPGAAWAAAFMLGVASTAVAQLTARHSGDFNHKYEGDVVPVPNFTEAGTFQLAPSTDGDIMSFRTGFGPYLDSDDWDGANLTTNGWTIEFRVRIDEDFAEGARGALALYTGNGSTGDILGIGTNRVMKWAHGEVVVDTNANTDAFHTFRVAFDRDGVVWPYTIYRDGLLLDTSPNGGNWGNDTFYLGSGGSIYGGPSVHLDYLRWDDTGAYEPTIPEVSFTNAVVDDVMGMAFDTDLGATYELEYAEPPLTNDWLLTGATLEGDGGSMIFFDPTGPSTSKVYRIVRTE